MAVRTESAAGRALAQARWGARSRRVDHLIADLDAGRVRVEPDQAEALRAALPTEDRTEDSTDDGGPDAPAVWIL